MYEPQSQNPQPEPGQDITRSYEWRFRDPGFVTIWSRWQKAREAWRKAWWRLQVDEGGPDNIYDPDVSRIVRSPADVRAAAQEFLDARTAYKAEVARRDQP